MGTPRHVAVQDGLTPLFLCSSVGVGETSKMFGCSTWMLNNEFATQLTHALCSLLIFNEVWGHLLEQQT